MTDYDYRYYWGTRYLNSPQGAGVGSEGNEGSLFADAARRALGDHDCVSALDVGCGAGEVWQDNLPVAPPKFTGVDVSLAAVGYARERYPNAHFRQLDVTGPWWFPKESFDAVICLDLLFHIKPEHYEFLLQRLFDTARRVVVVKTIEYQGGIHQFNHGRPAPSADIWQEQVIEPIPPGPIEKRLYVFARE